MKRCLALGVLCVFATGVAHAHTKSVSYLFLSAAGADISVELQMSALDRTVIAAAAQSEPDYLMRSLSAPGCTPATESFKEHIAKKGDARFAWRLSCAAKPKALTSSLLFSEKAGHVQLVSGPLLYRTAVLTQSERTVSFGAQAPLFDAGFWGFLKMGVAHILSGLDHVIFVLLLVIVARSLQGAAIAVTGFTVGHSITLSLAALGYTRVDVQLVEMIIAISIFTLALENFWLSWKRWSPWMLVAVAVPLGLGLFGVALFVACTFILGARRGEGVERIRAASAGLFGMAHGFGFAGVLSEATWSKGQLMGLLSFNLGVEIGQLGVVAIVFGGMRQIKPQHRGTVVRLCSLGAVFISSYLLVERAL